VALEKKSTADDADKSSEKVSKKSSEKARHHDEEADVEVAVVQPVSGVVLGEVGQRVPALEEVAGLAHAQEDQGHRLSALVRPHHGDAPGHRAAVGCRHLPLPGQVPAALLRRFFDDDELFFESLSAVLFFSVFSEAAESFVEPLSFSALFALFFSELFFETFSELLSASSKLHSMS